MPVDPLTFLPLPPRDYLVLFVLSDGPRHGYGIVKEVEESTDSAVMLDPSNLYRALKRLMAEGLVREAPDRRDSGDDDRRRYYQVTSLGRDVVRAEAARLARMTDAARARKLIPGPGRPA